MSMTKKITEWLNGLYGRETCFMSLTELRENYPLNEELTDDDTVQISHKRSSDGVYETRFATMKQIKEYLLNK